jgi:tetratricopeptide (TPR) repeat protein
VAKASTTGTVPVPTIAEVYSQALQHHQSGNLHLAVQMYQQILQADPNNPDAHHMLGLAAHHAGRLEIAESHFRQAITLNPWVPSYYCNLGNALDGQNKLDEAIGCFRQALRLNPEFPEACFNLGNVVLRQGKLEEAIDCYAQALRLNPGYVKAQINRGIAQMQLGRLDEAVSSFQLSLGFNPNQFEALTHLGIALRRQGKLEDAVNCYERALQLQPNYAIASYNLGNVRMDQEKFSEAATSYRKALQIQPEFAEAVDGLGNALLRQGQLGDSMILLRQAIQLRPNSPESYTNLGCALAALNQLDEALRCFQKALSLKPDDASAHWNRSYLLLLRGEFEQGWQEFDWRRALPSFGKRQFSEAAWDGSPLDGRTILLHAEQGLGDTIQFIRYAVLVRERSGNVVVECQPRLARLLANVAGIDLLVTRDSPLPPFDVQSPLLSLPGVFRTSLGNIPTSIPYLRAESNLVDHWRREITMSEVRCPMSEAQIPRSEVRCPVSDVKAHSSDFRLRTPDSGRCRRIGIAWQGNPSCRFDCLRSIPLRYFASLANVEGVQLISLQKGPGVEQLQTIDGQFPVIGMGSRLDESSGAFVDTAAVMMNLDLVISSDTAIPHLAGALGVPVWVALPLVPDWRWWLQREDSPWYVTMRLFRQTVPGRWDDVFSHMAEELKSP